MQKQKGFTLLELLVVISIIGVLASVLLVSFPGAQKKSRLAQGLQFSDSLRASLQADMVAWWTFDETSGAVAKDSWWNKLDGTVYGGATFTKGVINNGLSFDGANDYVDVGNGTTIDSIRSAITLSAWVKPNDINLNSGIIFKCRADCAGGGYSEGRWNLSVLSGGVLQLSFYFSPGYHPADYYTLASSAGAIANSTWQHVVGVFDGDAMRIYINGRLVNTRNVGAKTIVADDNLSVFIGSKKLNIANFFNGSIDDVQIYSVALPVATIQQHYADGLKTHQPLAVK